MMNDKGALLYCRVAYEDAFALSAQETKLRVFAERNGFTVTGVLLESGNGITLERPILSILSDMVQKERISAVIVSDISRIVRGFCLSQEYLNFMQAHHVSLISLNDGTEICALGIKTWSSIKLLHE